MVKGNQKKKLKSHTMELLLSGYGSEFSLMFANDYAKRAADHVLLRGTKCEKQQ